MVFRCFIGRVVVLLVPPEKLLEHTDFVSWLKDPNPKLLHDFNGQLLEPGDSIVVPIGYVPLWMGLCEALNFSSPKVQLAPRGKHSQGPKKPEMYDEFATVVLHPMYEDSILDTVQEDIKTRIYQKYVGARIVSDGINDAQGFQQYIQKCAPPKVVKAGATS